MSNLTIAIHGVERIVIEPLVTCRPGEPNEFSARSIVVTYGGGKVQTISLYARGVEQLALPSDAALTASEGRADDAEARIAADEGVLL